MKVEIFLFLYTYDNAQILALSSKKGILELPSIDLMAITNNELDSIEDVMKDYTDKLKFNFSLKFKHIDTAYRVLDDGRSLSLYYCAYVPRDRLLKLDSEKYILEDVSHYSHNSMIRKFLCII